MEQLGGSHRAGKFFRVAKPTEFYVEETAGAIDVADAAANQKLGDDGRDAGGALEGGHSGRIVTRNAPAFGHDTSMFLMPGRLRVWREPVRRAKTATTGRGFLLLFLFRVHRVLAQAGAEFFELELFAARFPTQSVVMIAGFLADEEYGFNFLFSFSSGHGGGGRVRGFGFGVQRRIALSPGNP
jgi:hypothetical protein